MMENIIGITVLMFFITALISFGVAVVIKFIAFLIVSQKKSLDIKYFVKLYRLYRYRSIWQTRHLKRMREHDEFEMYENI